jgi:hypothetical protein
MGLLDDAIREHLELKRRRGADPGEVAREQQEALDLVPGGGAAGTGVGAPPSEHGEPFDDTVGSAGNVTAEAGDASAFTADARTHEPPAMAASDETAELDMSAVLAEDGEAEDTQLPGTAPAPHPSGSDADELLEWEVPGDADDDEADESAEDVLEETPEFLRDTPEEDRLWFEQRPPRDFDFDK